MLGSLNYYQREFAISKVILDVLLQLAGLYLHLLQHGLLLLVVLGLHHTRMIKTEEKAKVVTTDWGEEFIQFLA